MKRQPWGLYAIALAIVVVGLVALGVPASTLLVAALALTCPLMMIFMMRGMRGGQESHGGVDSTSEDHKSRPPTGDSSRRRSR
jgi:hypothetical protein